MKINICDSEKWSEISLIRSTSVEGKLNLRNGFPILYSESIDESAYTYIAYIIIHQESLDFTLKNGCENVLNKDLMQIIAVNEDDDGHNYDDDSDGKMMMIER